jgi:lactate dehydrogenase-like 2-hydroxyacid dehydrogenase
MKPALLPTLLIVVDMTPEVRLAQFRDRYEVIYVPRRDDLAGAIAQHGAEVQAVLTTGSFGLTQAQIAALPKLEIICCLGVGYENVALDTARARGIVVTNGAGANAAAVADHAMALLLATVRQVPRLDQAVRGGLGAANRPVLPSVYGKVCGILGLGAIGAQVARRALGFDMTVGYHNRRPVPASPYTYYDSAVALAAASDFLIVATPGGAATHHLVDEAVLRALGPRGFLVNVGRGNVVDTGALGRALRGAEIAGAGLDVYEGEPDLPATLQDAPNLVVTPHTGGLAPEAVEATAKLVLRNLDAHFAGAAPITPVQ